MFFPVFNKGIIIYLCTVCPSKQADCQSNKNYSYSQHFCVGSETSLACLYQPYVQLSGGFSHSWI